MESKFQQLNVNPAGVRAYAASELARIGGVEVSEADAKEVGDRAWAAVLALPIAHIENSTLIQKAVENSARGMLAKVPAATAPAAADVSEVVKRRTLRKADDVEKAVSE